VTGALFLRSIGLMRRPATPEAASGWLKACAGILAAGIAIVVGIALVRLPGGVGGYDALAAAGLGVSGVTNPVTAVLLNYRSFDTLLEVMVLIAALVAVIMIGPRQDYVQQCLGPLFAPFAAVVVPLSIVVAGYLLWLGSSAPGGAFQAGAVLGAGLSILLMGRVYTPAPGHAAALRWLAIGGLVVFAGAGILSLALTGGILQYPDGWDKVWIVTIEAALTVSIGVVLAALFHGGLPKGERE
jgi:multisubunit Na+/H+ antiporter MnhB subunit